MDLPDFTTQDPATYKANIDNNIAAMRTSGANLKRSAVDSWCLMNAAHAQNWYDIAYAPDLNLYCAIAGASGTGNQVMTSPDGVTWTEQTAAASENWSSIVWADALGLFVAVATTGTTQRVMTSPDGITWTPQTCPTQTWVAVSWSGSVLIAVAAQSGTSNVMTSTDGTTWTIQTGQGIFPYDVTYSPTLDRWVACGATGTLQMVMTSDDDGVTWALETTPNSYDYRCVTWSEKLQLFVALNQDDVTASVITSVDGDTWESESMPWAYTWRDIAWSEELEVFIAIGHDGSSVGVMAMSEDGVTWTEIVCPISGVVDAIAYAAEKSTFVVVGPNTANTNCVAVSKLGAVGRTVILDTPINLVYDTTPPNLATAQGHAILTAAKARAAILHVRSQSVAGSSGNAASTELHVYKPGEAEATVNSKAYSRTAPLNTSVAIDSSECTVNLDDSFEFEYSCGLSASFYSRYINIALVGYIT